MICLGTNAVSGLTPAQVAENIKQHMKKLPPSIGGNQFKLSPDAKKTLGGKRKAHAFLGEVGNFLQ